MTKTRLYFSIRSVKMKAVVVVPMFAPIMTISPCERVRRPAQIKATTTAVTPEDD